MSQNNGQDDLANIIETLKEVRLKVLETHMIADEAVQHLSKLTLLEDISTDLSGVRNDLVSAATGREHVPTAVVMKLMSTMALISTGLTGVIIFLLIGNTFGWWTLHQ